MILFEASAPAPREALADAHSASQQTLAADLDRKLSGLKTLGERVVAIRAAIEGPVALSSSLGIEDQAITHAIATSGAAIEIFTLDTGRLFPETLDTLFETEGKYGIKIRVMFPGAGEVEELVSNDGVYGFRYSVEARKACCEVRKVRPLNRALKGAAGWITGLRREQSQGRSHVPFAAYDAAQKLIKLNPIADWTLADLEAHVAANKIPINALHARSFLSIRAGRWWWENENGKECGLHTQAEDPGFEPKDRAA